MLKLGVFGYVLGPNIVRNSRATGFAGGAICDKTPRRWLRC